MRTQEEIVEGVKSNVLESFFGFATDDLVSALDFDHAKEFLKPTATPERWAKVQEKTDEVIIGRIVDYMSFAIGKACDHRGLSANRSIEHFHAWMWLLGRDNEVDWENYQNYGCPILMKICTIFEIDYKEFGDVESFERMAEGRKCSDDCMEGCDA